MYTVAARRDAIMANRIKEVRKEKGITQKELAEKLGITPQAVSQFEKSDSMKFKQSTLVSIAEALECSVDDLVDFDDIMEKVVSSIDGSKASRNSRLTTYLMSEASKLNRMGHDALSSYMDLLLNTEKYTSTDPAVLREAWGDDMYEKFYPRDETDSFLVETSIYHSFDAPNEA